MSFDPQQIQAAKECLREAVAFIARRATEAVVRQNFAAHIYRMFPERPRWAQRHIEGGETRVDMDREGVARRGFIDNLVDSTAIEYEANLDIRSKFTTGYDQVRGFCAGLLNAGRDPDMVVGVLSDTVRWRAYRVASVNRPPGGTLGAEHLELEEIARADGSEADDLGAQSVLDFLVRYLGRLGGRPLSAESCLVKWCKLVGATTRSS